MSRTAILLMWVLSSPATVIAQSTDSIIRSGFPYPNPATVQVHTDNGIEQVSLRNWKGQPVIVDFFSSDCVVCLASLPKLNQFRKDFQGRVRFLLVAKEDNRIRKVYKKYETKFELNLDVGFDSLLHGDIHDGYPWYVWIDGNGIVQGVTRLADLTKEKIEIFARTQKIDVSPLVPQVQFDGFRPLGINGNGGSDTGFVSRSLFTKWLPEQPYYLPPDLLYMQPETGIQLMGTSMGDLYRYAFFERWVWFPGHPYYARIFPFPVFENGEFLHPRKDRNKFNYSLWVGPEQMPYTDLRQRFREDVVNQFGYDGQVEYRTMPCYVVTVRPGFEKVLRSRSDTMFGRTTHTSMEYRKATVSQLIETLAFRIQFEWPFIDESGIDFPVDFKIEAIMSSLDDVRKELFRKGIQIEPAVRPMKVLVLRQKMLRPFATAATK
ncbi:MAG: TlpA family protein disulfide reductase [Chitinophagaceae bacterium]|nr:MAG: TlpA family protein disulfide reductase [Chitinophagaceae bacterium]